MRTLMLGLGVVSLILLGADPVLAADDAVALVTTDGMKFLTLGIAVFGAAAGQAKVLSAALDSIGRNPGAAGQMFLPWLLGIVFIEALFVLTWLVAAGFI